MPVLPYPRESSGDIMPDDEENELAEKAWITLIDFLSVHEHIPDEALLHSGEVIMDGHSFYKLRNIVKTYFSLPDGDTDGA